MMRNKNFLLSILGMILILTISTCGKKTGVSESSPIVVKYGKKSLRKGDLEFYIKVRHRMEKTRFYFGREGQMQAARDYILQSYFSGEARKNKFQPKENMPVLIDASLRPVMVQKLIDDQMKDIKVEDKEIRQYYEAHTTDFIAPEEIKVRHLFLEIPTDATKEQKNEIRKKMESIRQRALEGEDFAKLANKYSEVQSKEKGGDIGYIQQGQIKIKSFEEMAFSMETGKISPIVETIYGYHILIVEDKKPSYLRSFQEVKNRGIVQPLLIEIRQREAKSRFYNDLLSRYSVERYYDRIEKYKEFPSSALIFKASGHEFTMEDFQKIFLNRLGIKEGQPIPSEQKNNIINGLETLIVNECVYQEAKRINYSDQPLMQKAKTWIEDFILSELYQEYLLDPDKTITPEIMKKYYETNQARFKTGEKVVARQIYVPADIKRGMLEGEKKRALQLARKEAIQIRQKIKQGANFSEMAKRYSRDESADSGGYIGEVEYGKGGALFDTNAFRLKPGEISDPVELKTGYLIIKVEKKIPAELKKLDDVKEQVRNYLIFENKRILRDKILNQLVNEKKVEIYEERI